MPIFYSLRVAESIEDFDNETFVERLSTLTSVSAQRIDLRYAASSTIINATLHPLSDPEAVQTKLNRLSILEISNLLGVHVLEVLHEAGPLRPAPPPSAASPSPSPTDYVPSDHTTDNLVAQGDDEQYAMYVGFWLGGIAVLALIIYCIYECYKTQVREFCCPTHKGHAYLKEVQLEDLSTKRRAELVDTTGDGRVDHLGVDVSQVPISGSLDRVNAISGGRCGRSASSAGRSGRSGRVSFAATQERQGTRTLLERVSRADDQGADRQGAGGADDDLDGAGNDRARLSRVLPGCLHSRRVSRSGVSPYVVDPRERGVSIAGGVSSDAVGVLHSQC